VLGAGRPAAVASRATVIAVAVLLLVCTSGVASPHVAAAATAGQLSFGEPGTQRSIVLVPCTTAS
jgi:hypothetical protein